MNRIALIITMLIALAVPSVALAEDFQKMYLEEHIKTIQLQSALSQCQLNADYQQTQAQLQSLPTGTAKPAAPKK